MIIFGIDPGVSGAISVLENKKVIEVFDMPTMIDGKKNKRQVNGSEVTNIIKKTLIHNKEAIIVFPTFVSVPEINKPLYNILTPHPFNYITTSIKVYRNTLFHIS